MTDHRWTPSEYGAAESLRAHYAAPSDPGTGPHWSRASSPTSRAARRSRDGGPRSATSPGRRSPPRPSSCSSPEPRWCTPSASTRATRTRASSPRTRRPSRPPREARPSPTAMRRSTTCYRTERPSMERPKQQALASSSAHCSSAGVLGFSADRVLRRDELTPRSGGRSSTRTSASPPSSVRSWTRCSTPGTAGWTAS